MNRPPHYWTWLLADVALDRAENPLALLDFPTNAHRALQQSFAQAGNFLLPGSPDLAKGARLLQEDLRHRLGPQALLVEAWLQSFPFSDEAGQPALHYWDARLFDLLQVDPEPALEGMADAAWSDLLAAYRGVAPKGQGPWASAFKAAALVRRHLSEVLKAIEASRAQALSDHDLNLYLRMGWNDQGGQPGLTSLEIGARLAATRAFWQKARAHVPQESLIRFSELRDRQGWDAASDPDLFAQDAARLGRDAREVAVVAMPLPQPAPAPDTMLLEGD